MEQQRLTDGLAEREPLGPPPIRALLRMPVDAVRRQMTRAAARARLR
jgi:hypothetical protein